MRGNNNTRLLELETGRSSGTNSTTVRETDKTSRLSGFCALIDLETCLSSKTCR